MSETPSSVQVLKPTSALKELNFNTMSAPVGILSNTDHAQQKKPSAIVVGPLSDTSESDVEGANQIDYGQGYETEPEGCLNPEEARETRETLQHENIIKSGYLEKKQERRNNWKRRWFVLRSTKLAYYKSEKEYELLRNLDLNDIRAVAEVELKNKTDVFGIVTPKRTYYVQATNKKEVDEWVEAINKVKKEVQDNDLLDVDDEGSQADSEIMNSKKGKLPAEKLQLKTPLSSGQVIDETVPKSPEARSPVIDIPPSKSTEQGEGANSSSYTSAGSIPNGPSSPLSPVAGQFMPERRDSSSEDACEDDENGDTTIRSGYVYKLDRYKKTWKKRWFVLKNTKLLYYKDHESKRAHKNINLSSILDAIEIDDVSKSKQHCFKIITPKRNYICRTSNEELQVAWLAALQMALNKTKEKRKE